MHECIEIDGEIQLISGFEAEISVTVLETAEIQLTQGFEAEICL